MRESKKQTAVWTHFVLFSFLAFCQLSFGESRITLVEAMGGPKVKRRDRVSVIPMFGFGSQTGQFSDFIQSNWSVGLAVDVPVKSIFSVELEAGYENHRVQDVYRSSLHRVLFGSNLKFAPRLGFFRPYAGLGAVVIYNTQDQLGLSRYARWMGAGQLMLGADVFIAKGLGIGLRANYVIPLINRPPQFTFPSTTDAIVSSNHFRFMGTLTFGF